MILRELAGAAVVAVLIAAVFAVGEILRRRFGVDAETSRKTVHVGGCLVALAFPLAFKSHFSVLVLAVVSVLAIVVGGRLGLLHSINDVERKSQGGIFHPMAIYICFLMATLMGNMVYYAIAIMVMALSDTMAALVGQSYGIIKYDVDDENRRSLEGSIVFFLLTFLIVHLSLLLLTEASRGGSVLAALLIAVLVTLFEAISLNGADNLFVPIGTIFILSKNTTPDIGAIQHQFVVMAVAFTVVHLLMRPYRKFGFTAYIAFSLAAYTAGGLVGWSWLVCFVVAIALLCRTGMFLADPGEPHHRHHIHYAFRFCIVPAFWMFASNLISKIIEADTRVWFGGAYVTAVAAEMAILRIRRRMACGRRADWRRCAGETTVTWLPVAAPMFLWHYADNPGITLFAAATSLAATAVAALAFNRYAHKSCAVARDTADRSIAVVLLASVVQCVLQIGHWWTTTGGWQ